MATPLLPLCCRCFSFVVVLITVVIVVGVVVYGRVLLFYALLLLVFGPWRALVLVQLLLLFHLVSLLFAVVVEYVPVVIAPIAVPRFGLFVLSIGPLLRFFTFVVVKTFCCKNGN